MPSGAVGACRHRGDIDGKLQREMREHVRDDARHASPFRLGAREARRALERIRLVEIVRPFRRRHLGHAAEQALGRSRAHKHAAVGAHRHEGGAAPQPPFPLRRLARKRLRIAAPPRSASIHPWAEHAGRLRRRADGRAEVHQRLREIAAARSRARASAPADGSRLSPPAIRPRPRTAAPPPARHCRRPAPRAHRTRSQRSPLRCSARYRAASQARPRCAESRRAPPPPARRRADCGRARSSRARPTA